MEENENLCVKKKKKVSENIAENTIKLNSNTSSHTPIIQTSTFSENISFENEPKSTKIINSRSSLSLSSDSDEENNKKKDKIMTSTSDESNSEVSSENIIKFSSKSDGNCNDSKNNNLKAESQNEVKEKSTAAENEKSSKPPVNFASIVAAFYNSTESLGERRNFSKIWYLRNFNNWIKANLIDDSVTRLKNNQYQTSLKILDMCCGKGGDIIKWLKLNVRYLVMTDIAEVSLKECEERFRQLYSKNIAWNRDVQQEVILADCTKDRLRYKYKDPSIQFDIVSCQFSFHYCFESLPQAECMLKNATECLKPGGFFIGTLPSAEEIVKRLTLGNTTQLRNNIFSLEMMASKPYALFGAKYKFKLEGVVDCPEFLVHFPTFVRLAENFGLKLVAKKRFDEMYEEKVRTGKGIHLLRRMDALETYPPLQENGCHGPSAGYIHAKVAWEKKGSKGPRLGTLSKFEWEIITLYDTFIFQKQKRQSY